MIDGAFDRILVLGILAMLGWIIYEKRKGNDVMSRFVNSKVETGDDPFGVRKYR